MPSTAANAKNALVYCLTLLSSRLAERGGEPSALPDFGEWLYIQARAHFALNPVPPIPLGETATWKEFARLEKAYRPKLKFRPLFEPFLKAVEAGVCPYAKLQATHWDKLSEARTLSWGPRKIKFQVIDWLIFEIRGFEGFNRWELFPTYDEFRSKNSRNELLIGTPDMWKIAGQLLSSQMGHPFKSFTGPGRDELSARAGYEVFIKFQKQFQHWCLKQPEVEPGIKTSHVHETEMLLMMLGYAPFEERLVKIRLIDYGKSTYREPWVEDANQLKRLQVPTLYGVKLAHEREADTARKRELRGSEKRRSLLEEQEIMRAEEAVRLARLSRDTAV